VTGIEVDTGLVEIAEGINVGVTDFLSINLHPPEMTSRMLNKVRAIILFFIFEPFRCMVNVFAA
jgi:hypothetical protein